MKREIVTRYKDCLRRCYFNIKCHFSCCVFKELSYITYPSKKDGLTILDIGKTLRLLVFFGNYSTERSVRFVSIHLWHGSAIFSFFQDFSFVLSQEPITVPVPTIGHFLLFFKPRGVLFVRLNRLTPNDQCQEPEKYLGAGDLS